MFNSRYAVLPAVWTILIALTGCDQSAQIHEGNLKVLDTVADINISSPSPKQARAAVGIVEKELARIDRIGYTFKPDSELHRLNEAIAEGRSMIVSVELRELLARAKELSLASKGFFNPSAGELTALWEFHCPNPECSESPYPDEVERLVKQKESEVLAQHPSMEDLSFSGNRITSRNPAVKLEFGDVIRGFALDKGVEMLRKAGIDNAMLDLGGSVRVLGAKGAHPWWAGIPDASGQFFIGTVELTKNEAVVTVRAFEKSIEKQGSIYRHVVDPRSGFPVRGIQSVTVIHSSATTANAAAAALLVAGLEEWAAIADSMQAHTLMMITADGTIYTSLSMEQRIRWKQNIGHKQLAP